MTREQAKKNLITFGIEEPSEEHITNYLNQVNGETQKEKDKVAQYKEKADKFDSTQAELEAEKHKNMTAEEKLAAAEKIANEKAIEFAKKSNKLDVAKILVEAGLTEDDYKDIIDTFVSDDAEKSKATATAFATLVTKQKETATQKAKENLMDDTTTPGGDKGDKGGEKTEAEKIAETIGKSFAGNDTTKSVVDSYL